MKPSIKSPSNQGFSKVMYLASEYPAISHTFILREVQALREHGVEVITVSVNHSGYHFTSSCDEQEEKRNTRVLKSHWLFRAVSSVLRRGFGFRQKGLLVAWRHLGCPRERAWILAGHVALAFQLADQILEQNIEHLHVHFANGASDVAQLAADLTGITWSMSVHGPDSLENVAQHRLTHKLKSAHFVRCISDYSRYQLLRHGDMDLESKLYQVRCGVSLPEMIDKEDLEDESAEAGTCDPFQWICVGRLVPAKGQLYLLRALAECRDKGHRVHCRLIGQGPDMDHLKMVSEELNIEDIVEFCGPCSFEKVTEYLLHSDGFVLPSLAEGIPVSLMEAMAQNIPVVSTSVNGIPELIESGKTGYLAPPANVKALVEAMEMTMVHPETTAQQVRFARQHVAEHFNIVTNGERMARLFLSESTLQR